MLDGFLALGASFSLSPQHPLPKRLNFSTAGPCLVAMEACGSAHYWAREIARRGHQVRLMLTDSALAEMFRAFEEVRDFSTCHAAGDFGIATHLRQHTRIFSL